MTQTIAQPTSQTAVKIKSKFTPEAGNVQRPKVTVPFTPSPTPCTGDTGSCEDMFATLGSISSLLGPWTPDVETGAAPGGWPSPLVPSTNRMRLSIRYTTPALDEHR